MIATIPKVPMLLLTTMLGGCSLIGMHGVDPQWDGKKAPECSDNYTPVYVDSFLSSIAAGTALDVVLQDPPPANAATKTIFTAITSLLFMSSAFIGASRYRECRKAKAGLYVREALGENGAQGAVAPTTSQGYFCTYAPSQPELYACAHERDACEQVRKVLAISDGQTCMPRDPVWCFDIYRKSRCFGTQYACEKRRAIYVAKTNACTERT